MATIASYTLFFFLPRAVALPSPPRGPGLFYFLLDRFRWATFVLESHWSVSALRFHMW